MGALGGCLGPGVAAPARQQQEQRREQREDDGDWHQVGGQVKPVGLRQPKHGGSILADQFTLDLIASFQRAIVDDLVTRTLSAARAFNAATLFVTGGVAANQELRRTFEREAAQEGLPVYFPSRPLSTDNAAMIAAAAYPKFLAKDFAAMDFSAEPGLALK